MKLEGRRANLHVYEETPKEGAEEIQTAQCKKSGAIVICRAEGKIVRISPSARNSLRHVFQQCR